MKPSENIKTVSYSKTLLFLAALCMCGIFVSCGGANGTDEDSVILSEAKDPATVGPWHNLLNSKYYSGYISVMFKDGTGVRLENVESASASKSVKAIGIPSRVTLVSRSGADLSAINESITSREKIEIGRGVPDISEENIDFARGNAAEAGVTLEDWNLLYRIAAPDPAEAEALIAELKKDPNIRFVEPVPFNQVSDAGIDTPSLLTEQTYLQSNSETGGLNVVAGWNAGATGKGVVIVDEEVNWNFNHEDLPIDETDLVDVPDYAMPSNYTDAKFVQHGTAVVGILAGKDNNGGVKGIAYDAEMKLFRTGWATQSPIIKLVVDVLWSWNNPDGSKDKIKRGDIILIEMQSPGPTTTSGCDVGDVPGVEAAGCVPEEAYSEPFFAFKNAVDSGFVIVEGGGNGSLDLASPEARPESEGPDLSVDSSGAIMVGASTGPSHQKASWSNCGVRMDAYAWGNGVVSAGYGNNPISAPNDPNKWYTNQFSGTSSASALVAGAVAQIQSYIKKVYADAGLMNTDAVYFTTPQIKQILQATGVPAVGDEGCNIGVQPDVGAAIAYIDSGAIEPTINYLPAWDTVVSGIRYDIERDGKADLISFSRDRKWYIDLSSVDGFGAWDVVLDVESSLQAGGSDWDAMLFPVVHDYNSDGRADLALYDSKNGLWYIKYTSTSVILSEAKDPPLEISFDKVIDYSSDPNWKAYSRPIVQDVNADRWVDIVLQAPDGKWEVDLGGMDGLQIADGHVQYLDKFGTLESSYDYLTQTELSEAPGWAWLPASCDGGSNKCLPFFKSPDGVTLANYINVNLFNADGSIGRSSRTKQIEMAGGNDSYFVMTGAMVPGFKKPDGSWIYAVGYKFGNYTTSAFDFDDILCRPISADYDGDGMFDLAVQCGTTWKIAYSSNPSVMTQIELTDAIDPLPATVYAGGIKYQDQLDLFNYYKTKLPCQNGNCTVDSTIFDVQPPIGPYFAECVQYWQYNAATCWNK